ncbi:MAG: peptidase M3, partial [Rubrivivax sp.]
MSTDNPLLAATWHTPHGLPPFDLIRPEHFEPAFEAAMVAHKAEVDALAQQSAQPSFDNTVAAFDRAGRWLGRLESTFYNLTASETSDALQAVQMRVAAPLAAHGNAIYMHQGLFARLDAVHAARHASGLTPE